MNSTDNNTSRDSGQDTSGDTAAGRAETGTAAWEDAVRLQRWATPDHAGFYALAGEAVATLYALDDLVVVLRRQVAGYAAAQQARGRRVYDDTREVDPEQRLADAADELAGLITHLQAAQGPANRFWSAVGHIGSEDAAGPADGGAVTS